MSRRIRKVALLTEQEAEDLERYRVHLGSVTGRVPSEASTLSGLILLALNAWRAQQQAPEPQRRQRAPLVEA